METSIIISIFSAIIALTSLGVSYSLTKKNQLLLTRQTAIQELAKIEGIFTEYPELYEYFYENKTDFPDEETRIRAIAISHRFMNIFANLLLNQRDFPKVFNEWVDNTIAKRYGTSPILAETMVKFQDEYKLTGKRQLELMQKGVIERNAIETGSSKKSKAIKSSKLKTNEIANKSLKLDSKPNNFESKID